MKGSIFGSKRVKNYTVSLSKFWPRYRIHIIAWAAFITWESVIVGLMYGAFGKLGNYVVHYAVNITFFYFYTWLLEKATLSSRQSIWKVPLYASLGLIIYIGFVFQMDNFLIAYTKLITLDPGPTVKRLLTQFWRGTFFALFATGYFFLKRFINERAEKIRVERHRFQMLLEKERVDKELEQAKNAFLKAQINPHLLFNTLEILHQRIKRYSPEDAQIMVNLSEMMRFSAAVDQQDGLINLGEEIEQCENLIQIQHLNQGQIAVDLAYAPDVSEYRFIPLVVLTLLENMFKHGNLHSMDHRASLAIYQESDWLRIECINVPNRIKSTVGFGSGLKNIESRLAFAYPGDYEMNAGLDEDGNFKIEISVRKKALKKQTKTINNSIISNN
jgi:hypothetical protein